MILTEKTIRMKIGTTMIGTHENAVAASPSLAPLCPGEKPVENGASIKNERNTFEIGKF